ncbi:MULTISPECIES: TonB-dependent receptor [Pseudomonadati]|uniref:TonB-dependent receptor n=1 Tax=Shewanella aestuarii TaxID=1028752 RepID=A0ABT0L422_9GAMM|nr:TonB-dependent receptor [Shewanella aestuarii]MCL1118448.1 TonB-dependent receptor [Shewanella aestuarii]GGN82565.1 TonB-dependent receptor [Shewanella aestuarii]
MLTKLSAVAIAVTTGLLSYSVHFNAQAEQSTSTSLHVTPDQAAATHSNIERIEVTGRQFNHYKVGTASGAMRGNIDLMDTPQSVAIIPDFVTDEQLAKNLSEVLVNDSSVTAGSEKWNRQVFSLRGFELDSGSGYLINGHQQWSHYVQPIETLQQVEVLKGPSSMLYGQSGPGGLINMVTKKPTYDTEFELGFDTDDQGSTRFQADAGGSINDAQTLRYRTVLVKQDSQYWRNYANTMGVDETHQERDRWLGFINLEYDITDDLLLSLKYDHTQDKTGIDRGGWLDSTGELIGGRDLIWDMPWAFTDNTITNKGGDLTYHINDNMQLKTGYNHQQFNRQRLDTSPNLCGKDSNKQNVCYDDPLTQGYFISPFDRYDDWQHETAYMDFTSQFNTAGIDHQLLLGGNLLNYYYGQLKDSGPKNQHVMPGVPVVNPGLDYNRDTTKSESDYKHYGFYLQDLISFNDSWQALVGTRYDEQKKDGEGNNSYAISPKFGVIYSPTKNGSIYANYSQSFSPQGMVNNEEDINDKMDLEPEYGTQYELGAKWELYDGSLLLTGAIFDITVSNVTVQQTLVTPVNGKTYITTQEGEQRHKGAEIGAQGQVADKWFVTGSMMYLNAEYSRPASDSLNGKTPIDAPEFSANLWTRYEVTENFALNFGATYVGERYADSQNTITKDDYIKVDVGAAYTMPIMGSDVSLRMNIRNLFDKDYLSGGGTTDVTVGQGRNVNLALEAKF